MELIEIISLAIAIPAAVITIVVGIVEIIKLIRRGKEQEPVTNATPPSLAEREQELRRRQDKAKISPEPEVSGPNSLLWAELYLKKGEVDRAQKYFNAAIEHYVRAGDKDHLARAKVGLSSALLGDGKHDRAIRTAGQVEYLTEDPALRAEAQLRLGIGYRRIGKYREAQVTLTRSLEIWKRLQNPTKAGETLTAIGDVYRKLGELCNAVECYKNSIKILREETKQSPSDEEALYDYAQAQYALGRIYIEENQYNRAKNVLSESYQTLEQIGAFYGIEMCSQLMGRLHKQNREFEEARHWFYESFVATAVTKNDLRHVETLFHIAELAFLTGQFPRAYELASVSADDAERLRFHSQLARLLVLQGHVSYAYLNSDQTSYLRDYTDITVAYQNAILAALRAGPASKQEIFSRIQKRIKSIAEAEKKRTIAKHIVDTMIEWWPQAVVNSKAAEEFEKEQDVRSGSPSKRVSEYLGTLQNLVS